MELDNMDLLQRLGLATRNGKPAAGASLSLSGIATDPETGQMAGLFSDTGINKAGQITDINIQYWRQFPYGEDRAQNLITVKTKPGSKANKTEIDQIWVQAAPVYDASKEDPNDTEVKKKVSRLLESVNRLNTMLREKGPVQDTARILRDCCLDEVVGENIDIRGLKKEGGFKFRLSTAFMKEAARGKGLQFRSDNENLVKTVLGFTRNALEPDKDHWGDREVFTTDPQSGVSYVAGAKIKKAKNGKITFTLSDNARDVPKGVDAQDIDEVFKAVINNGCFEEMYCLGKRIDTEDPAKVLKALGFAQACNYDLANWKYPAFMDHLARYDMLSVIDPLPPPRKLEDGGDMYYVSLHGSGTEKRIEEFGDQVGSASLILHRGKKADGSISTVCVAIDFPFMSGGPKSNFDGAVPDYMQFWDDISAFKITHDHFDHADGLAYYAKAGMMVDKPVYATARVKWILKHKMDFLNVPPRLRPKIHVIKDEDPVVFKDEDDNERIWIQACPNAVKHSALCTPFIITGCVGNKHCNGSLVIYGDSNGMTEKGKKFFRDAVGNLRKAAGFTKEMLRGLTVVLHDFTSGSEEGNSPTHEDVEPTLTVLSEIFSDKGMLMAPFSTNNEEYIADTNVAHNTGRDLTGVGSAAEVRMACINLFGMLDDVNLREFRLDPFEELEKQDPLIPRKVLDIYFNYVDSIDAESWDESPAAQRTIQRLAEEIMLDMDFDREDEDAKQTAFEKAYKQAYEEAYEECIDKKREQARQKALTAYKEELEPSKRGIQKNVGKYMLDSLFKHGAVVFEDDYNGYLMWKAILDRNETASIRVTRSSQTGKDMRLDPGRLMIFVTGPSGNSEERFSTLQKFADFFSLLDVDEKVRNTGYKINPEDFVAVIQQPAVVGNEDAQENLINELVSRRNITVVAAFKDGFKVYNPKDKKNEILARFKKEGWDFKADAEGNIRVYGRPIHVHGHGRRQDMVDNAKLINAEFNELHHVTGDDACDKFAGTMTEEGLHHSGIKPDDFKVMRIDAHAPNKADRYKKIAELNPSYILIKLLRKYGHFFGGELQLTRTTLLRREGGHRADGLMARVSGDGIYSQKTARRHWEAVSNPNRHINTQRERRVGPSLVDRGAGHISRSRPAFSYTPPGLDMEAP